MKIILIILQGLLTGVLNYPQEDCQKEKNQIQYYIYNANVEIKAYPCLLSNKNNIHTCEDYNYENIINNYPNHIANKCLSYHYPDDTFTRVTSGIYETTKHGRIFITLCKISAYSNLLEDTIEYQNKLSQYKRAKYYDKPNGHFILWSTNICQDLHLTYTAFFDVWTDKRRTKHIRNEQVSLKLTEKKFFCDSDMWMTDYDGVVVSTNYITTMINETLTKQLHSKLPHYCDATDDTSTDWKDSTTDISTTPNNQPRPESEVAEKLNEDEEVQKIEERYLKNKKNINKLKFLTECLMFVAALFVLWCVFNVMVNFNTLWTAGKRGTSRSRAYLINCVFHSSTSRYLYLNLFSGKNGLKPPPKLYESVENEFYNKPL